jgi:hypothetical protein
MTNSTHTLTLTDFLLARIAEDEARAGSVYDRNGSIYAHLHHEDCPSLDRERPYPCDCGVTTRVLAECEAKRRIVEPLTLPDVAIGGPGWAPESIAAARERRATLEEVALILASVYRDHPDFREEWA